MNYKFSTSLSQTNEASYRTINYPNINSLSLIQNHSKQNTEANSTNKSPKFLYHLTIHRPLMNNKNDLFLDEDDTKNNENFQIFLENLFNKEENTTNIDEKLLRNEENSSINSNKKFFLGKIKLNNYKYDINKNKKEEEKYYSFRDNKKVKNKINTKINNKDYFQLQYKLKNFLFSIPKKSKKQIIYNNNNYNDKDYYKNNFDSTNDILQSFQTEKKNIGIDCKISNYYNNKVNKAKKRNNTPSNLNKLTQTFSFKQFDGEMLNNLIELGKLDKKSKKTKNNSFNHFSKYVPEFKIPKIIFYSRNNQEKKDKITEKKLNTMKENVMHFLKDKKYNLVPKNTYNNNKKINNNNCDINNIYSKDILNPFEKIKLIYGGGTNIIPYLVNFDKNYKKKMKKKRLNINNKKNIFSSLKIKNKHKNCSNININSIYDII
jgi:hypothetical protein